MKYLIVGAGFSGATIARELAEAGHDITVIDKRNHVAGNAFDFRNAHGIRVHKYGPHLFHTKNEKVWNYLSRFTEWLPYEHRVKALLDDGTYVPFPPNVRTKGILGDRDPIDVFYRPYTLKMWGRPIEDVAPSIIARVPGRDDLEDRYFPDDPFQGLPKHGYEELVWKMLDHDNIDVVLSFEFNKRMERNYDHVFNSMPIDVYYDFEHGELEYRSIKFLTQTIPLPSVLPTATVNFTHSEPFTRVTEWKKLPGHGDNPNYTTITSEEPCDYRDNDMERYYPINDYKNKDRYVKYRNIENKRMTFIGRCGQYVYIDMDQAVNSALRVAMDFK